jgi:hypothetical protein
MENTFYKTPRCNPFQHDSQITQVLYDEKLTAITQNALKKIMDGIYMKLSTFTHYLFK